MKIFGMGGFELVIILVVILLIFGPKNLPKLGSAIGKTVSNLRSGMNEGKKKKQDETENGEADEAADSPDVRPAAIEGEVETVETANEADEAAGEAVEADGVAEEAPASKKVKRVVKKKTVVDEPAE